MRSQFAQVDPLGRLGRVDEMASAALFLPSSDISYCTGMDLVADSGCPARTTHRMARPPYDISIRKARVSFGNSRPLHSSR